MGDAPSVSQSGIMPFTEAGRVGQVSGMEALLVREKPQRDAYLQAEEQTRKPNWRLLEQQ